MTRLSGQWTARLLAAACLTVGMGAAGTGDTRLVEAARKGDTAAVRALLKSGADVNTPLGDGSTALHWAAQLGAVELADALISSGANVNAADDLGVTPLWVACESGSGAIVEKLLKARANPNAALASGETPLMVAAHVGNSAAVTALLVHGADVKAREGSRGQTALMWAAAQRHGEIVEALIKAGADVHARSNVWTEVVNVSPQGFTNSGIAAGLSAQEVDARAAARRAGGGPGVRGPVAQPAAPRPQAAVAGGGVDDVDTSGIVEIQQGGYTALLFAAQQGAIESARALIAAGANVNDTAPIGTSALVVAAHSNQGAVGAFLLEKGADPNAAEAGYTAMHAAILRGDVDLVKALVAHGADLKATIKKGTPARRQATDYMLGGQVIGATPFWLAARFNEPGILRALAAGGADRTAMLNDTTPLMAAMAATPWPGRGRTIPPGPVELERMALDAIKAAVEVGVNVNAVNNAGDTALHTATTRGYNTVIQFLGDAGALVDVKNKRGQTPLATAVRLGRESTIELLRKLGAHE